MFKTQLTTLGIALDLSNVGVPEDVVGIPVTPGKLPVDVVVAGNRNEIYHMTSRLGVK